MGVTRLLANEWAKHNINVNAIAPGYMATNNTQQLRADEQRSSEILDRIPAGRWGLPADLMGPVVFLASSASDYINGYTVAVDGGWLARANRPRWPESVVSLRPSEQLLSIRQSADRPYSGTRV